MHRSNVLPACVLIAALGVAAVLVMSRAARTPAVAPAGSAAARRWQRWHAMSSERRAQLAETYARVNQQREGQRVLADAAAAARLDPQRRARLRRIHDVAAQVLRAIDPPRRRWVDSLPPDARAAEIYRLIDPQVAKDL